MALKDIVPWNHKRDKVDNIRKGAIPSPKLADLNGLL